MLYGQLALVGREDLIEPRGTSKDAGRSTTDDAQLDAGLEGQRQQGPSGRLLHGPGLGQCDASEPMASGNLAWR